MEIVRIIIFIVVILYLVLALFFVHITVTYQKQLSKSTETLASLFAGQIALFKMLGASKKHEYINEEELNTLLAKKDLTTINKILSEKDRELQTTLKTLAQGDSKTVQIINGIAENVVLIRNEVYRYNKLVANLNINKDSLIFALFVVMLRLKTLEKI